MMMRQQARPKSLDISKELGSTSAVLSFLKTKHSLISSSCTRVQLRKSDVVPTSTTTGEHSITQQCVDIPRPTPLVLVDALFHGIDGWMHRILLLVIHAASMHDTRVCSAVKLHCLDPRN